MMLYSSGILIKLFLVFKFFFILNLKSQANINDYIRDRAKKVSKDIDIWYKYRNYSPVWDGNRLSELYKFIKELNKHGLSEELFNLREWDKNWQIRNSNPVVQAEIEVSTTNLCLFAIQSLAYGYVAPKEVHSKWESVKRKVSAYHFLDNALNEDTMNFANYLLENVPPQNTRYMQMINVLDHYRRIESSGGLEKFSYFSLESNGNAIGLKNYYKDLSKLRYRLQLEKDLPLNASLSKLARRSYLDRQTQEALKSYQFRHGIRTDGFIGRQVIAELNVPIRHRINTLIINLDRLRWMPRKYEKTNYIEVNIAESALRLFNSGKQDLVMKIIVGKKGKHQTPVFNGDIKYIIFRPYWNVPKSIAKKEIVPRALKYPQGILEYMNKNEFEIVSFYGSPSDKSFPITIDNLNKVSEGRLLIHQRPGNSNSLGSVKFIFPNESSIYLHDTPDRHLFKRADRDFSHGCIRVSQPDLLSYFLLRNKGISLKSARSYMIDESISNKREDLSHPFPVYLIYWTSYVMGDRRIRFDQDIYGHDKIMFSKFRLY